MPAEKRVGRARTQDVDRQVEARDARAKDHARADPAGRWPS